MLQCNVSLQSTAKMGKRNYSCSIKLSEGCNLKISYTKGHKSAKMKILDLSMSFYINILKDKHFVILGKLRCRSATCLDEKHFFV